MIASFTSTLVAIGVLATLAVQLASSTEFSRVSDKMIWRNDALDDTKSMRDSMFQLSKELTERLEADEKLKELKSKYEKMIKGQRVDVVAPGSDLTRMMNLISTKTAAMFLEDYDKYFRSLNIQSTSKPMLLSYLGLHLVSQDKINQWYGQSKSRVSSRVVKYCQGLIEKRKEIGSRLESQDLATIDQMKATFSRVNSLHMAHMVHQNNMNLFMLESFIILCTRLEGEALETSLKDVKLLV